MHCYMCKQNAPVVVSAKIGNQLQKKLCKYQYLQKVREIPFTSELSGQKWNRHTHLFVYVR